ncbi:hypothetical protein K6U06_02965 [Acidiferrimicrobium sp. IK]|uniref:hypothetical protein n=1 Tax=Acidiferrimicrobium sp. IK TaxID=2871700 RepID=UPI0021CB2CE4|nr:hypothetical protein [Acidiferrimicrobium sp. IK]MCU4183306.1 hypothetical protein [Acidiferrimicrobium sp. IK]
MPSTHTPASEFSSSDPPPEDRYGFRFDPRYVLPGALFGVTPFTAWLRVTQDELVVRFGLWSLRTPLANVAGAQRTGPYRLLTTLGPARGSFVDRGATFATNPRAGVCIRFERLQSILLPGGLLKSPGLTVTVAEVDRLAQRLQAR